MNFIAQIAQDATLFIFVLFVLILLTQKKESDGSATKDSVYERAWWVTVTTEQPNYEYFFGPFEHKSEAEENLSGYLKDLAEEGATLMATNIRWCKPQAITRALK